MENVTLFGIESSGRREDPRNSQIERTVSGSQTKTKVVK